MRAWDDGREALIAALTDFRPWNEQEEKDRALILHALRTNEDIFTRQNTMAHMTASAWVVNPSHDRALMAWHNIYHSWSWLGGHADGQTDLLAVALREVREESGIQRVRPLLTSPFSLESLTVDGHEKRSQYVSSHLHLNVTYLLEADDSQATAAKPDENSAVGWLPLEEAVAASSEDWFRERVYAKLNSKLKQYI
ncbi:MAG: NUDIX hydrolase [Clostridia bacterium]|nr:NUDIX hydrolase [Clostridia bacterium]